VSNAEAQCRMKQARAKRRSNHDTRPQSVAYRHEAFVREYLIDFNATKAAIRAGYSPHTAKAQGSRLLTNVDIQRMVEEGKERARLANRETADSTLRRLELFAKCDKRRMFDAKGNQKEIRELDEDMAIAIKGYDFLNLYDGSGDQKHCYGQVVKIRFVDPLTATIKLGEHFGLFDKKPQVQVNILNEFYLRSKEELRYFIQHGKWPEPESGPRQIGSGTTSPGGQGTTSEGH